MRKRRCSCTGRLRWLGVGRGLRCFDFIVRICGCLLRIFQGNGLRLIMQTDRGLSCECPFSSLLLPVSSPFRVSVNLCSVCPTPHLFSLAPWGRSLSCLSFSFMLSLALLSRFLYTLACLRSVSCFLSASAPSCSLCCPRLPSLCHVLCSFGPLTSPFCFSYLLASVSRPFLLFSATLVVSFDVPWLNCVWLFVDQLAWRYLS